MKYYLQNYYRADEGEKAIAPVPASAEEGTPVGEPGSSSDAPTGDGEIVGGPRNMQQIAAQRRLQQTHAQVQEVLTIAFAFTMP